MQMKYLHLIAFDKNSFNMYSRTDSPLLG